MILNILSYFVIFLGYNPHCILCLGNATSRCRRTGRWCSLPNMETKRNATIWSPSPHLVSSTLILLMNVVLISLLFGGINCPGFCFMPGKLVSRYFLFIFDSIKKRITMHYSFIWERFVSQSQKFLICNRWICTPNRGLIHTKLRNRIV